MWLLIHPIAAYLYSSESSHIVDAQGHATLQCHSVPYLLCSPNAWAWLELLFDLILYLRQARYANDWRCYSSVSIFDKPDTYWCSCYIWLFMEISYPKNIVQVTCFPCPKVMPAREDLVKASTILIRVRFGSKVSHDPIWESWYFLNNCQFGYLHSGAPALMPAKIWKPFVKKVGVEKLDDL